MNRLELIYKEIKAQAKELKALYEEFKKKYWGIIDPKEVILTGCGDSYAAALLLSELTNAKAFDPYELSMNLSDIKTLIIISVSGKTRANLILAEKAKKKGIRIIALTGNKKNKLSDLADFAVVTNYEESTILPGTLSFTKNLVALYSIFALELNLDDLKEDLIEKLFEELIPSRSENFFIISTPGYYPLTLYWKAKLVEFLGAKVITERCEQFMHVDIFSLEEKDSLIILGDEDHRAKFINDNLKDKIAYVEYFKFGPKSPFSYLLGSIYAQVFSYKSAKERNLKDVYFAMSKNLKLSDEFIY